MDKMQYKFTEEELFHTWLTSDDHFYHENIIRLCGRPFKDVEEMNEKLIDNWNRVVGKDDIVFNLGDFAFASGYQKWKDIIDRLNGKIVLIKGNHEQKNMKPTVEELFYHVTYQMQIEAGDYSVYLNHYPFLCYGGSYREKPVLQAFGHVHTHEGGNGLDDHRMKYLFPTQYDVGVDNNNFTPISLKKFIEIIEQQIQLDKHEVQNI